LQNALMCQCCHARRFCAETTQGSLCLVAVYLSLVVWA